MITVHHYGLHTDEDGYEWVLQNRGEAYSPVGLPKEVCPLEMRSKLLSCPHNFNFSASVEASVVKKFKAMEKKSPILRFISPVPRPDTTKVMYVETTKLNNVLTLISLLHFWNPVMSSSNDVNEMNDVHTKENLFRKINNSNLSTILLHSAKASRMDAIHTMVNKSFNAHGKLLIAGERVPFYGLDRIMSVQPYEPELDSFICSFKDITEIRNTGTVVLKDYLNAKLHT